MNNTATATATSTLKARLARALKKTSDCHSDYIYGMAYYTTKGEINEHKKDVAKRFIEDALAIAPEFYVSSNDKKFKADMVEKCRDGFSYEPIDIYMLSNANCSMDIDMRYFEDIVFGAKENCYDVVITLRDVKILITIIG